MKMAWCLFVFVSLSVMVDYVVSDSIKYKDCGSTSGTITNVDVTGCPTEPCQFVRNTTVKLTIDFTANVAITAATNKMYGYIAGVKVPFPTAADGCKDMPCPIAKGQAVTYKNAVFVLEVYPKVSLVVEMAVLDQNNQLIICVDFPAQITDG